MLTLFYCKTAADAEDEVRLFIEDCESGERQCFRVDVLSGETAPCES